MTCPNCNSVNVCVHETINAADGKVYRRRRCNDCRAKFRTVEVTDDGSPEFKQGYSEALKDKTTFKKR